MAKVHHVNLAVSADQSEAQEQFLLDVLGYEPAYVPDELKGRARWFELADGSQVHLSESLPHTALEFGDDLGAVEERIKKAGFEYRNSQFPGQPPVLFVTDPGGNSWELRGSMPDGQPANGS